MAPLYTVLITGFAAFDHQSANPSGDAARALNGTCRGRVCFESFVLSVDSDGARAVADELSAENASRWDAVLHVGEDVPAQFQTVNYAHLELVAANLQSQPAAAWGSSAAPAARSSVDAPSRAAATPSGPLIDGAQDFLPATAKASNLAAVAARDDVIWHRDAGNFYCNEAFYRTTYSRQRQNPNSSVAASTEYPRRSRDSSPRLHGTPPRNPSPRKASTE